MVDKIDLLIYVITLTIAALLVITVITDNTLLWIALSGLGEEYFYAALSLLILVFIDADIGVMIFYSIMLSGAVNIVLKNTLKLPRPPESVWRVPVKGYGFPSGHTQVSTSFWVTLLLCLRRNSITLLAMLMIISVGLSRIALRVHYVTDVVGGFIIGAVLAFTVYGTLRKSFENSLILLSIVSTGLGLLAGIFYTLDVAYKIAGLSMGAVSYIKYREEIKNVNKLSLMKKIVAYIAVLVTILTIMLLAKILVEELHTPLYVYTPFYALIMPGIMSVLKEFLHKIFSNSLS